MKPSPLHLQVAQRQLWARRATFAGLGALVGSAVALLLGLGGPLHLLLLAAGGLLGLAWPQPSAERRALRWVGERAGLAYETAWESAEQDDPQGLIAAVRTQGRLTIRALRMPTHTPWWAPALGLALAMWLLASLGGLPQGVSPFGGSSFQEPPGQLPPVNTPVVTDEGDEGSEADLPPPPVDAAGGAPSGTPGAGQGGAGTESIGGQGGEASDRDALERFVEGLRNRPPEEEAAAMQQATVPVTPGEEDDGEEGDAQGEGRMESDGTPGDEAGQSGESGDGGEGEAGEDGDQAGQGEDGDDQAGQEGDQEGGPGDTPAGDGDASAGQGQQQGLGAGEGDEAFDAGEGDEGGLGGGVEAEVALALGLEGELAEAESLEGLLGVGPEQVVGGLLLPGYGEDAAGFLSPEGVAAYQRAVEQALIDGDLPVPYQEVIRNYFR